MQKKGGGGMTERAKDYLTLKEIAEASGVSYGSIKRDIDKGKLSAYRIGRKYFVAVKTGEAYCKEIQARREIEGYTVREIMDKIPLSYAFIMDLIKKKKLKAVKVGRQYIVPKEEFAQFMAKGKLS